MYFLLLSPLCLCVSVSPCLCGKFAFPGSETSARLPIRDVGVARYIPWHGRPGHVVLLSSDELGWNGAKPPLIRGAFLPDLATWGSFAPHSAPWRGCGATRAGRPCHGRASPAARM